MTREAEIIITLPDSQVDFAKPTIWEQQIKMANLEQKPDYGKKEGEKNTLLGLLYWKWHPSTRLVREHKYME